MCFYFDDGHMECVTSAVRKARKQRRCTDCGGDIRPGERYRFVNGLWEREWYESNECRRCAFDRLRIIKHELSEGCRRWEAEPALDCIGDALSDYGWTRTDSDAVPDEFNFERDVPQEVSDA